MDPASPNESVRETRKLVLLVSEPWDLYDLLGGEGLDGGVEDTVANQDGSGTRLLKFRLDEPLTYRHHEYDRLVLAPRGGGSPILDPLLAGEETDVGVYGIPVEAEITDIDPQTWWRGGLGADATARLI